MSVAKTLLANLLDFMLKSQLRTVMPNPARKRTKPSIKCKTTYVFWLDVCSGTCDVKRMCLRSLSGLYTAVYISLTQYLAVTLLFMPVYVNHFTCMQNDEYCSTCGTKKDSDKLLCCELCPAVYHLYCLKPPLKSIPAGDWFCTHCRSILGLEHVEKFLAARTRMVVSA